MSPRRRGRAVRLLRRVQRHLHLHHGDGHRPPAPAVKLRHADRCAPPTLRATTCRSASSSPPTSTRTHLLRLRSLLAQLLAVSAPSRQHGYPRPHPEQLDESAQTTPTPGVHHDTLLTTTSSASPLDVDPSLIVVDKVHGGHAGTARRRHRHVAQYPLIFAGNVSYTSTAHGPSHPGRAPCRRTCRCVGSRQRQRRHSAPHPQRRPRPPARKVPPRFLEHLQVVEYLVAAASVARALRPPSPPSGGRAGGGCGRSRSSSTPRLPRRRVGGATS